MITTFHSNKLLKALTLLATVLLVLSSCQNSEQQTKQQILQPTSLPKSATAPLQVSDSLYTENIEEFKSKKYNQRLEGLVGCWLMSKEYLNVHKSNYLFFKDLKLKEIVSLKLVKECMKKINRKQAILKITQLVGKNIEPAKKYEDIIDIKIVDNIFDQISKFTIANYNQYQPINEEGISTESFTTLQNTNDTESSEVTIQDAKNQEQAFSNQQTSQKQSPKSEQMNESEAKSFKEMSEFDLFLVDLLQKYNEEFQLATSKEVLKGKVQEELKKRQKYYFGFIPASSFSHSVFLVTISLSMLFCCTCFKYYRMRSKERQENKLKNAEQCDDNCKSHSHGQAKTIKKVAMAKMTEMTMKKKNRRFQFFFVQYFAQNFNNFLQNKLMEQSFNETNFEDTF